LGCQFGDIGVRTDFNGPLILGRGFRGARWQPIPVELRKVIVGLGVFRLPDDDLLELELGVVALATVGKRAGEIEPKVPVYASG
jgi:hypothetical protein